MSKKLIPLVMVRVLVLLLCLLCVCLGFFLGQKMTSVPEHQPSKETLENPLSRLESASDSSGSNLRIRSEPQLLRFEAGAVESPPFETYGLLQEASCKQFRVANGKLEPAFGGFGSQLFVDGDLKVNFPKWLMENKIVTEGDHVSIYRGCLSSGYDGLRVVVYDAEHKRRILDEATLIRIDDGLRKNGYGGYARQQINHDDVYAWAFKP